MLPARFFRAVPELVRCAQFAGHLVYPNSVSQVPQLLAEGLPNKTIAERLGVSEHTIKFHVNAIFRKLGAQSRTDAVVRATRLGLILL